MRSGRGRPLLGRLLLRRHLVAELLADLPDLRLGVERAVLVVRVLIGYPEMVLLKSLECDETDALDIEAVFSNSSCFVSHGMS